MKKLIFLIALISTCTFAQVTLIPMTKEKDTANTPNPNNKVAILYFEQLFADSMKIEYKEKTIFDKYVKTVRRYSVAKEVCKIDSVENGKEVSITIGKEKYKFKIKKQYAYYYFSRLPNKLGIVYSNIARDYY